MSDQEIHSDHKPEADLPVADETNQEQTMTGGDESEPSQDSQINRPGEVFTDDQSALPPDSSTDSKLKPKKAQRTHRVQLPGPQGLTNPETGMNLSSQSEQPQSSSNLESISYSGNVQIPVQIPPQINALHSDGSGGGPLDKESAFVMTGLCCVAGWLGRVVRGLWHFTKGLVKSLSRLLFTPALLGAILYGVTIYSVFTFAVEWNDDRKPRGFEAALKYVLQNATWLVLPVFISFLVIHFNNNLRHQQFLYESVIDVMLMLVNSLIIACHAEPDTIIWLGPIFIVAVAFRCLYWMSLFYLQPKWQQLFHTPTVLNCIILTAYNLGVSIQANADSFLGSFSRPVDQDPADGSSAQDTASQDTVTSGQEGQGLLTSSSMCDIAEKIFCGVDHVQ